MYIYLIKQSPSSLYNFLPMNRFSFRAILESTQNHPSPAAITSPSLLKGFPAKHFFSSRNLWKPESVESGESRAYNLCFKSLRFFTAKTLWCQLHRPNERDIEIPFVIAICVFNLIKVKANSICHLFTQCVLSQGVDNLISCNKFSARYNFLGNNQVCVNLYNYFNL